MSRKEIVGGIGLVLVIAMLCVLPAAPKNNPFLPVPKLHPPVKGTYCQIYKIDKDHPADPEDKTVWNGERTYSVTCAPEPDASTIYWNPL